MTAVNPNDGNLQSTLTQSTSAQGQNPPTQADQVSRTNTVLNTTLNRPSLKNLYIKNLYIIDLDDKQRDVLRKSHQKTPFMLGLFSGVFSAPWRQLKKLGRHVLTGWNGLTKSLSQRVRLLRGGSNKPSEPTTTQSTSSPTVGPAVYSSSYLDPADSAKFQSLSNEQKLVLLKDLFKFIEKKGKKEGYQEGVFRISPNSENAREFFKEFMKNVDPKLGLQRVMIPDSAEPHEAALVIKQLFETISIFEEQKDSLGPLAQEIRSSGEGLTKTKEFLQKLSPESRQFLAALIEGLGPVIENTSVTKMNSNNLAVVFAPGLTKSNDYASIQHTINVFKFILDNRKEILESEILK